MCCELFLARLYNLESCNSSRKSGISLASSAAVIGNVDGGLSAMDGCASSTSALYEDSSL